MVDSLPSIPDFLLLRRIGRGSYGDVWLARSVTGVYRAVKVVYRSRFDDERPYEREFAGIRKFEPISVGQDTQVSLLHVGRNDAAGFFYYVMELADDVEAGEEIVPETYVPKTLKEMRTRQTRLPADECVTIGVALTRALAHLHRHGLVHRDIKPSNVIFVHGVPKLADIGLVSAVDTSASFVGTEGFVPPEGPGSVQADVYSLGKVLYEISTGRDRHDFPKLPDDLDNVPNARALLELNEVTVRACDSELKRRYPSAEAMHDDLVLLQAGKSVKRLHLIERRFRIVAKYGIAATAVMVIAVAAFLWASQQARESERHRNAAEQALRESQLNQARAQRMTAIAGRRFQTLELLRKSAAANGNRLDLRNEAIACLALPDLRPIKRWSKTPLWDSWRFDSRMQRYLTNDAAGNIVVRDVETDRQLIFFPTEGAPLTHMMWSPDDRLLATIDKRGNVQVRQLETGTSIPICYVPNSRTVVFTPDSRVLVAKHEDRSLHFYDSASGRQERSLAGPFTGSVFFNPAGDMFAIIANTQVVVHATADGKTVATLPHLDGVMHLTWHPDGRRMVTAAGNNIYFWEAVAGRQLATGEAHEGRVTSVSFDKTGELLATGSWDTTTRFWQTDTRHELVRAANCGNGLRICPDARRLSFRWWDHSKVELWEVASGREVRRFQVPSSWRQSYHGGFNPDGKVLFIANADGVYLFDIDSGDHLQTLPARNCSGAAFHPATASFITCGREGLRRWSILPGERLRLGEPGVLALAGTPGVSAFTITPDGESVAAVADDGFRVLNPARPAVVVRSDRGSSRPRSVPNISPDGKWVAMGKRGNRLQICNAQTGKVVTNIAMKADCVAFFSPDNRWLISGTNDEFQLWEVGSWKPGLRMPRAPDYHGGRCAAFSPDGKILAFSVADQAVRLMVTGTNHELATLPAQRMITHLCFSPDGTRLLATYEPGYSQLWDLRLINQQLAEMNLAWAQP